MKTFLIVSKAERLSGDPAWPRRHEPTLLAGFCNGALTVTAAPGGSCQWRNGWLCVGVPPVGILSVTASLQELPYFFMDFHLKANKRIVLCSAIKLEVT